jgi:hypothetical protein
MIGDPEILEEFLIAMLLSPQLSWGSGVVVDTVGEGCGEFA